MENANSARKKYQAFGTNNGGLNMKNKPINRRDFLKFLGGLLLAPLVLKFQNLLNINKRKDSLKEAKHYKSGDSLAG